MRRSKIWKEFVLEKRPGATSKWFDGRGYIVIDGAGNEIGDPNPGPMGSWNAAFRALGGTEDDMVARAAITESAPVATVEESVEEIEIPVLETPCMTGPVIVPAEGDVAGAFIPSIDPTFIVSETMDSLFAYLDATSATNPQNVMLVGPHGCGKTETAIQYAARVGKPLLIMDCAHTREGYLWWGRMHVNSGTTFFKPSDFFKAVEAGGHVILLDELNRVDSSVLSPLMPLLDGRRMTHVPDTDRILKVGPGTVFFASMNEGTQYTGTSALDAAIQDRFSYRIEVSYLEQAKELKVIMQRTGLDKNAALKLVELAQAVRKKAVGYGATLTQTISTRQLLATAQLFRHMGVAALDYSIASHFNADGGTDSERSQVLQMIQGKFGVGV